MTCPSRLAYFGYVICARSDGNADPRPDLDTSSLRRGVGIDVFVIGNVSVNVPLCAAVRNS
jgi:hypothetical protein